MLETNPLLFEVALGMIPGVGSQLTRMLVTYCGTPEEVFKQKKGRLMKIPGIGITTADAILNQKVFMTAEREIELALKHNAKILFYTSPQFPERLKNIPDAPSLLYYKGNANLNTRKSLSIVGTRNATAYGKEMIENIVKDLAHHKDLIIISGLAYGIDIAAHKAALQNQMMTIGVMAAGINIVYPALHKEVANRMTTQGGLITEYRIDCKPEPAKFPARNRIIAGLSDAVLVIEAAEKGGALITAEIANGYNREVFAVPGNIGLKYSEGCNKLIRDHKANIITSSKDLEFFMNWDISAIKTSTLTSIQYEHLDGEAKEVVNFLKSADSILLDDLSWQSQIPLARLASLLLTLEFDGIVKSLPGKKYKLNGK